jgi:hypothetical protein
LKKKKFFPGIEFVDYQEMLDDNSIYSFTKYIKSKYKYLSYKKIYIPKKVRFSDNFNKKNYKNFNKEDSSLSKQIQSLIKRQI